MKIKIIVLVAFLVFHNNTYSQSIFENFDSYNVGDKVSEVSSNFYAWNFNPDVDTEVTDEAAYSGQNSIATSVSSIVSDAEIVSDMQGQQVTEVKNTQTLDYNFIIFSLPQDAYVLSAINDEELSSKLFVKY